jgi:hypothetical protein
MIIEIVTGAGGFVVGSLATAGCYMRTHRHRVVAEQVAIAPELNDLITAAARNWAGHQSNPYAEDVARPWMETFVKHALGASTSRRV